MIFRLQLSLIVCALVTLASACNDKAEGPGSGDSLGDAPSGDAASGDATPGDASAGDSGAGDTAMGDPDSTAGLDCATETCPTSWCGDLRDLCTGLPPPPGGGECKVDPYSCYTCGTCQAAFADAEAEILALTMCNQPSDCTFHSIGDYRYSDFGISCCGMYARVDADFTELDGLAATYRSGCTGNNCGSPICSCSGPPGPATCDNGVCVAQ